MEGYPPRMPYLYIPYGEAQFQLKIIKDNYEQPKMFKE
jgi:hypothetical protein